MSSKKKDVKKDVKKDAKKSAVPEKPIMRGLHRAMAMKNIYVACGLAVTSTVVMYFVYNRRRINKFRNFYANYDAEEMFDRICAKGRFDCCPPPPPPKEEEEVEEPKKKK